ncbi:hypothetical protein JOQ06_026196, partial [Pogonophryne albipinna]
QTPSHMSSKKKRNKEKADGGRAGKERGGKGEHFLYREPLQQSLLGNKGNSEERLYDITDADCDDILGNNIIGNEGTSASDHSLASASSVGLLSEERLYDITDADCDDILGNNIIGNRLRRTTLLRLRAAEERLYDITDADCDDILGNNIIGNRLRRTTLLRLRAAEERLYDITDADCDDILGNNIIGN